MNTLFSSNCSLTKLSLSAYTTVNHVEMEACKHSRRVYMLLPQTFEMGGIINIIK